LDSLPDDIKRFKPAIRGGFITNPSPNSLLDIEARLVRWEVLQVKTLVGLYESSNLLAFVPFCAIHIKPDLITLKPAIEMSETSKEFFSVSLRTSQHSTSPQKRGNPTKEIQSVAMLACRRHSQPLAHLAPSYPKTGMQGEARFVFENNRLFRFQGPKFFLTSGETSWHPRYGPACRHALLASSGTPTDASTSEPGVPSTGFQIASSSGPLGSGHPSGLDLSQSPQEISPDALPTRDGPLLSIELASRVSLRASGMPSPARLPCASTSSSSDALNQALRLSIPDADPPVSAEEPQSLSQQGLPGFPELLLTNRLGSLLDAPTSNLGFA
jgi:hypothetical protein